MKFGYTTVYVPDVPASLAFFEAAFGLKRRFLAETNDYGVLETGATALAFAARELIKLHSPVDFVYASLSDKPLGIAFTFVTPNVEAAHRHAIATGAIELAAPQIKPCGQTVSHVRCPDGTLVGLCTPIG